ncbi:hypothetical protein ACFQGT_03475 [Natrialbaceae archaeon GCM10025810]|uniref:hypothetical protein n=1 Tax=Halovalidus salilacus TaxID=3075124 RepID=UPI00361A109C
MFQPPQYAARRCVECEETLSNVQGLAACPACGAIVDGTSDPVDRRDRTTAE